MMDDTPIFTSTLNSRKNYFFLHWNMIWKKNFLLHKFLAALYIENSCLRHRRRGYKSGNSPLAYSQNLYTFQFHIIHWLYIRKNFLSIALPQTFVIYFEKMWFVVKWKKYVYFVVNEPESYVLQKIFPNFIAFWPSRRGSRLFSRGLSLTKHSVMAYSLVALKAQRKK